MRVAVVTPYCREPADVLLRAHRSVLVQAHPARHVLVADGFPDSRAATLEADHLTVPHHGDTGATPRSLGALSAFARGFDAVAFLDADNEFTRDHVSWMVSLSRDTGAQVVAARRSLLRPDGSVLADLDPESDGDLFCDANCLFLTRAALPFVHLMAVGPSLGAIGDRPIWAAIRASALRRAVAPVPTVRYRTTFAVHYRARGESPPPGSKRLVALPRGGYAVVPDEGRPG